MTMPTFGFGGGGLALVGGGSTGGTMVIGTITGSEILGGVGLGTIAALFMTHPNHIQLNELRQKIEEAQSQYDEVFEMREAASDPLERGNLKMLLDQIKDILRKLNTEFDRLL